MPIKFLLILVFIFKHARKPLNYDFRLFINGKRLIPSECIKYLGVLLDSDLSWKSQINYIGAKLKRANGALAKLRHFVPQNILILVYYAIFHSHLQYCNQIWGQPNSLAIKRIVTLQNLAIRLMSFESQRTSSSNLYANLELLNFSDIVDCQNILLLHNLLYDRICLSLYRIHLQLTSLMLKALVLRSLACLIFRWSILSVLVRILFVQKPLILGIRFNHQCLVN